MSMLFEQWKKEGASGMASSENLDKSSNKERGYGLVNDATSKGWQFGHSPDSNRQRMKARLHEFPPRPADQAHTSGSHLPTGQHRADGERQSNKNSNSGPSGPSLKIDISFADHPFIIGRQGNGIQTIMDTTGVRVHFPDSNRKGSPDKSNQVSLNGDVASVLVAHKRIREVLPVSFVFFTAGEDLARLERTHGAKAPQVLRKLFRQFEVLQNEFNVTISPDLILGNAVMTSVRGRRNNIVRIREGLLRAMEILAPGRQRPAVYLGLEVSPNYLEFVLGRNNVKVDHVSARTNTHIEIVYRDDVFGMPTILIRGQVDNVYEAWSQVINLLPATIVIDIAENLHSWRHGPRPNMSPDSGLGESSFNDEQFSLERSESDLLPSNLLEELNVLDGSSDDEADSDRGCGNEMLNDVHIRHADGRAHGEADDNRECDGRAHGENNDEAESNMEYVFNLSVAVNELLYDYDISVVIKNEKPSLVARAPERYLGLLMKLYTILNNPNENPIRSLSKVLRTAEPPIRYDEVRKIRSATASPYGSGDEGCNFEGGDIPPRMPTPIRETANDQRRTQSLFAKFFNKPESTAQDELSGDSGIEITVTPASELDQSKEYHKSHCDSPRLTSPGLHRALDSCAALSERCRELRLSPDVNRMTSSPMQINAPSATADDYANIVATISRSLDALHSRCSGQSIRPLSGYLTPPSKLTKPIQSQRWTSPRAADQPMQNSVPQAATVRRNLFFGTNPITKEPARRNPFEHL